MVWTKSWQYFDKTKGAVTAPDLSEFRPCSGYYESYAGIIYTLGESSVQVRTYGGNMQVQVEYLKKRQRHRLDGPASFQCLVKDMKRFREHLHSVATPSDIIFSHQTRPTWYINGAQIVGFEKIEKTPEAILKYIKNNRWAKNEMFELCRGWLGDELTDKLKVINELV